MAMTPEEFHEFLAAVLEGRGGRRTVARRESSDLRGVSPPGFEGNQEGWGDRFLRFKQIIKVSSQEAYTAFENAEASDIPPTEEGLGAEDPQISAKFFASMGQMCKGEALAIFKGIEDSRRVYACSRLAR